MRNLANKLLIIWSLSTAAAFAILTACSSPVSQGCAVVKAANDICVLVELENGQKVQLNAAELRGLAAAKASAPAASGSTR